jgi:hypothetical protein
LVSGTYKFLHARHVTAVLDSGTIKIGSLSYYRGLESSDQWIADRLEGRVEIEPGEMIVSEHEDKLTPLLPRSLRNHVRAESGGTIQFAPGVKITVEHPEVYIFSASTGYLTELRDVMCRKFQEQYDACIGIRSFEQLAHRMFFRGRVLDLDNAKMSHLFTGFQCSAVSYEPLSRTPALGRSPEASPFLKDTKFKSQSECRIAFWPRDPIQHSTLLVQLPRPNQLFKEMV